MSKLLFFHIPSDPVDMYSTLRPTYNSYNAEICSIIYLVNAIDPKQVKSLEV